MEFCLFFYEDGREEFGNNGIGFVGVDLCMRVWTVRKGVPDCRQRVYGTWEVWVWGSAG
jgi:hypothetical protein